MNLLIAIFLFISGNAPNFFKYRLQKDTFYFTAIKILCLFFVASLQKKTLQKDNSEIIMNLLISIFLHISGNAPALFSCMDYSKIHFFSAMKIFVFLEVASYSKKKK